MHYKNGREAKVGDHVVGTCFNTKDENDQLKIISGTLISLTPGNDSCSAMVGFVQTVLENELVWNSQIVRYQGTEGHGTAGPKMFTEYKQDYTECKYLIHAEDASIYEDLVEDTDVTNE